MNVDRLQQPVVVTIVVVAARKEERSGCQVVAYIVSKDMNRIPLKKTSVFLM